MEDTGILILVYLVIAFVVILIIRWIGAWMLRIDELIKNQKIQIQNQKEIILLLKHNK